MKKIAFSAVATTALAAFIATGSAEASTETYTVKPGDSLWKISSQYQMTVDELKKLNRLTSDMIRVDQKLSVTAQISSQPVGEKAPVSKPPTTQQPSKPTPAPAPSVNSGTYIVKAGDSLWKIASHHQLSVEDLKKLNHLVSDTIYVNQKLVITSGKVSDSKPSIQPDQSGKPGQQTNPSSPGQTAPTDNVNSSPTTKQVQQAAVNISLPLAGTPYVWSGTTKAGFDCSGFIHYVFNAAGLDVARTDTIGLYSRSYYVDKPVPGDLVFFENTYRSGISHAGIYLGEGKFIHAGTKGVEIASLDSSYWKEKFDGYKRFYALD